MSLLILRCLFNNIQALRFTYFIDMKNQNKKVKALLCQVHPLFKKREENIARFDQHLQFYAQNDSIDIVLFPQMTFVGYCFKDHLDALPFAIAYGQGAEFDYAKSLAKRLNAYVSFGYIEKAEAKGKTVLYNSAAVINREGNPILNTRKTHLYFADELWAEEGDGFKTIEIINTEGQKLNCGIGICMDINQKHFTSGKYQFGQFIKLKGCEIILFLTNWVDSQLKNSQSSMKMYNYWLERLNPVSKKHVLFLAADRVGPEYSYYDKEDIVFLGSSCALSLNPHQLIERLDKTKEAVLQVDYELPL